VAQQEATLLLKIKQAGQEILDRFVITLGDVVNIAKSVASALYSTIEAYREEEKAVNQLTQAMIQQGVFTSDLRSKYLEQASALQKLTTYGDEQIVNAQRILQSMVGNQEVTEDLTRATLDFAAAKGIDLASAAELVGKSIASETNVLSRYGIQIEQSASQGQKLTNVITALNSKFEGQAQAAAQGLGKIDQLKNTWSDFLEKTGAALTPFVIKLAEATTAAIRFASALLPNTFSASKNSVAELRAEMERLNKEIDRTQVQQQSMARFGGEAMDQVMAQLEARRAALQLEMTKALEMEKQAAAQAVEIQRQKFAEISRLEQEKAILDQDRRVQEQEMLWMNNEELLKAQMALLDKQISNEQSAATRKKLIKDRERTAESLAQEVAWKRSLQQHAYFLQQDAELVGAFSQLATAIMDSESKALFLVQQGAALATTWMLTQVAAMQALASIPYPANLAAAANIETIGYIKMAAIGATTLKGLAEGGVVKAQPGGAPFIIGEGGRDEAVIPLEDGMVPGMSGGNTYIFNGPVMGDAQQAREFAVMIDRELLRLRRRNESVAFEDVS
jgi:hypothetical protein